MWGMESRLGHANKMMFVLKYTGKKHHQNILKGPQKGPGHFSQKARSVPGYDY